MSIVTITMNSKQTMTDTGTLNSSSAMEGLETRLWAAADALRSNMDKRWVYGVPPAGNANYAWVQHFIYHLAPTGLAGFVLANGSMSSN